MMATLPGKCASTDCDRAGTELRIRGAEHFYYCKLHADWWDEIMGCCY